MDDKPVMASDFKQRCLALLDEVAETKVAYVVTKHGKPVARVVPIEQEPARPTMGSVTLIDDEDEAYFSTGLRWDAEA